MQMKPNGSIVVRPGDSISKYCSEIYNIPPVKTRPHWNEFGRIINGKMTPLKDVNHIQAGWTIYHIPTHNIPSHLVGGEEIQITATAWPRMQFRLLGLYGKVNYSVASSVTVIGELQVKFSHLPDLYAWEAVVIFALVDPLGSVTGAAKKVNDLIKGADVGAMQSDWSSPLEFHFREFNPVEFWKDHKLYPECMMARFWGFSRLDLYLKWALPKQYVVRRPGQNPKPTFHIDVPKVSFGMETANPLPNFDAGPAAYFNVKNFHKVSRNRK